MQLSTMPECVGVGVGAAELELAVLDVEVVLDGEVVLDMTVVFCEGPAGPRRQMPYSSWLLRTKN